MMMPITGRNGARSEIVELMALEIGEMACPYRSI